MGNFHLLAILFAISIFATLTSCQNLRCYDCDPNTESESCADPVTKNARNLECQVDADIRNSTSICVSIYRKYTGAKANLTGIYRGCETVRPDIADFCDWFREENREPNQVIVSCYPCNGTRCNTIRFTADGKGGTGSISYSFLLYLNVIFFSLAYFNN